VSERGVCDIHPAGIGDPCNICAAAWAITDAELRERKENAKTKPTNHARAGQHSEARRASIAKAQERYNERRRVGRPRGEKHLRAVLTAERVSEIRRRVAAGEGTNRIAREYGVSPTCITHIVYRRTWRHVE
jgi:DNA invertase Pin-like site-specific DNA recombinase